MVVEMNTSMELFEKLEQLSNQQVVIMLKNGKKLRGKLIGFFKDEEFSSSRFAMKWHIVDQHDPDNGFDIFGLHKGTIVNQNDIAEVHFMEDNSIMKFV